MEDRTGRPGAAAGRQSWLRLLILTLVVEKIVQHVFVTLAFYFDWASIGSTVAVSPRWLMILGAIVAVLFAVALWGLLREARWAYDLVIGLALFDIAGEFVAQGRLDIVINVSFIVAIILLALALRARRAS